ncbi:hypothetical protein B0H14DRAFT_3441437 [Mycena olivaceomarginata]|nr:hypothetical protein B0H14DRAFT_3441437 [Mycena olivaceomarginata]
MQEIVTALGKDAYHALSPEDRRAVDLFIWGGCCMHKDLNSFKGGNAEMMLEWAKLGVPGPILLANKQNAAILRNLFDPATSTCGGVKTCALGGAIFNNKDDKKGQADKHVDFMTRKLETPHPRFPDTSNTLFGSYGGASAELITYLLQYLDLMDVIQWSKINPSLTNIEKNLRDALKRSYPHRALCDDSVRGPGTENVNLLDLGPLHAAVRDHIQQILDNPDIIFGGDFSSSACRITLWLQRVKELASAVVDGHGSRGPPQHHHKRCIGKAGHRDNKRHPDGPEHTSKKSPEEEAAEAAAAGKERAEKKALSRMNAIKLVFTAIVTGFLGYFMTKNMESFSLNSGIPEMILYGIGNLEGVEITAQLDIELVVVGEEINEHREVVGLDGVLRFIGLGVGGVVVVAGNVVGQT